MTCTTQPALTPHEQCVTESRAYAGDEPGWQERWIAFYDLCRPGGPTPEPRDIEPTVIRPRPPIIDLTRPGAKPLQPKPPRRVASPAPHER